MTKRMSLFLASLFLGALSSGWGPVLAQETAPAPPAKEGEQMPGGDTVPAEEASQPPEWPELKDPFESYLPSDEVPALGEQPAFTEAVEPEMEKEFDYASLVVTGIVWGSAKPKAIINGDVVGKGDVVNGAEIIDISKEGILFKYNDKEYLMKRPSGAARPPE